MVDGITMLWSLNKIMPFVNLVLGLAAIYFLAYLCSRIEGKILKALKLLTVAMAAFVVQEIFAILGAFNIIVFESIIYGTNFILILFVLLAVLALRSKVNEIDRNHDFKRKKKV